eukprot:COSAG01_NODE_59703_length_298_cov_62.814070_1_plen_65_part_01
MRLCTLYVASCQSHRNVGKVDCPYWMYVQVYAEGTIRHSLFYSLGGLLGDLTQPAQPGRPSAGAC